MALDFITNNPATNAYYNAQDRADKQAQIAQQIGVDTAVRRGINQMLQQRQPASSYLSPDAAPSSPVVAGPAATDQATTAPATAPATALPVPPIPPATPPPVTAQANDPNLGPSAPQMRQMRVAPSAPDVDAIMKGMSGGAAPPPATPATATPPPAQTPRPEAAVPQQLAMADPGTATDAPTGLLAYNSPGFIPQGYFGDPVKEATLNKIVHRESGGQNIPNRQGPGGTPLSTASGPFQDINSTWREGLQLAGVTNPEQYPTAMSAPPDVQIKVNGALYDKYGEKPWAASAPGAGRGQPAAPYQTADMSGSVGPPGMAFMPGYNTSRYDPILRELAGAPGGGTEALKLLQEQGRFDQNNYRRTDTYQRLAMQALNHGDLATADFYAKAGGMQLPQSVLSGQNNPVLLGRASLVAHQVYGAGNQEQAQRYVQTYMANGGDVAGAFAAAGVPRTNPQYQLKWVQRLDGSLAANAFSPRTGQMTPMTDQTGQPMTQGPRPAAGSLTLDHKVNMLVGTGMPYDEAVKAVTGAGVKPQSVQTAYRGFYGLVTNSIAGVNASEPERQQMVETQMVNVFGPNWRALMGGQGASPPPPPSGAGGLPMAPAGAGAPSTYRPPGAATTPPTPQPGGAAPGQGGPQGAPTPQDIQQAIAGAKAAIKQGKRREDVIKRLQEFHIPVPPDL
jgi:hypothetical protein